MKKLILALYCLSSTTMAARLEDVKILNVTPGQENFELKLQTKDGPKDSYFYVDIVKSDPESFEKLVQVIKKLTRQDKYKLDLDIQSFSASPNGSYYRSEGLIFSGPTREPDGVKPAKKKEK